MRFRDWFSIRGIRSELSKVRWLTKRELTKHSFIVLAFCICFGAYFLAGDALTAWILKALGI